MIAEPMDFATMEQNIEDGNYEGSIKGFARDLAQIFDNAMFYNQDGSDVYELAKQLKGSMAHEFGRCDRSAKKGRWA